jgi:hypothetical protein
MTQTVVNCWGKIDRIGAEFQDLAGHVAKAKSQSKLRWSPGMKTARPLMGLVAAILSTQIAAAQTLDDPRMPPGPNRELAIRTCIGCHPLNFLYSTVGRTREGWSRTFDDMVRYGMNVTAEERALVLEYLATSLGPS